ncbi:MAG TPA: class I SAM-dependent methyltransferase [Polyangiaceae bacterium]|nr:class I SAM-dependent methyltransferase [Polyangiaceae bacterium]
MTDFYEPIDDEHLLAGERCWDLRTERIYRACGEPLDDCMLQCRAELLELCGFIREKRIRSYLEIGIWTGRTVSALHRLFRFDLVAVCDHRWAEQCGLPIVVPEGTRAFWGDAGSEGFRQFRESLGPVDLVFIDANHSYRGVKRDFAINRAYPHRFLAFHDIAGSVARKTNGVAAFWRELDEGHKREISRPNAAIGAREPTMGIGLWSATEVP